MYERFIRYRTVERILRDNGIGVSKGCDDDDDDDGDCWYRSQAGAYWFGLLFPPLHLFLQPSPPSPVRDYSPGRPLLMDRLFVQEINI
ncbi:unnamed protein product [Onchocerca ochengi]|uniref:Uncharacterized protein n=1 Tax=Onchocerca ochengi TaxID=42157 RepID=A0A182E6W4_ONCOC|nr:unnamed protein product [Onchocerca ochengi]